MEIDGLAGKCLTLARYEKHFQCPIKFKAAKNVFVFNKADMDAAFLTYNADLLAVVAPQLEAELKQQLVQKSFREQVKGTLKRLLAGERWGSSTWRENWRTSSM